MTNVYTVPTNTAKPFSKFIKSLTPRQTEESRAPAFVGPMPRDEMVAQAAYFRAEHRGFLPGYELGDWLGAEAELNELRTHIS